MEPFLECLLLIYAWPCAQGITLCRALGYGAQCGAGVRTGVDHMQGKYLSLYTISLALPCPFLDSGFLCFEDQLHPTT